MIYRMTTVTPQHKELNMSFRKYLDIKRQNTHLNSSL